MKQQIYYLTLICLFLIAGCKKDDEKQAKADIVGKWRIESGSIKYYQGDKVIHEDPIEPDGQDEYLEFKEDGSVSIYSEDDTESGSYSISEDGKTLTLGETSESVTFQIVKLEDSDMVLASEQTFTESGVTVRAVSEINFKKF